MRTLGQVLQDFPHLSIPSPSTPIKGIHYDSRKISKGDLFVAVKGLTSNGHTYLGQIAEQGALGAIVERKDPTLRIPQWVVPDSRKALALMSARWFDFPSRKMTLIGVTGTNGKTTTTYLLESIIKAAGKSPGVVGTVNYRYKGKVIDASHTTPESYDLQSLLNDMHQGGVDVGIMEVSSHALELQRVVGCDFNVAIFTNLTQDHLDFHGNLDAYFESKAIFFEDLIGKSKKSEKFVVINIDDPRGEELCRRAAAPIFTYGTESTKSYDLSTSNLQFTYEGLRGNFRGKLRDPFHSSLVGMHNVYNILAAATAALSIKIPHEEILRGISLLLGVPGRLERVSRGLATDPLVLVDYAHTDDALRNVLSALQALPRRGRIITVFGCGGDRDPKKRPLMGQAAMSSSDLVIVTSDNPRTEDPQKIIDTILQGLSSMSPTP
ncbi:MAG TPA: UDP-N-acetylmuramoyl-L-alanyl-D-glutamate--2,6-diaminopimelate ligase [Bdellovibrionota bacterium]|nr:UDP-N-acetylmuramoyl-L-alanyl-D-glutamate--2,6-diaminopimelate ligase [Bdellovibrionota bacterium]